MTFECPHFNLLTEMLRCPLGFPGCHCADDMMEKAMDDPSFGEDLGPQS